MDKMPWENCNFGKLVYLDKQEKYFELLSRQENCGILSANYTRVISDLEEIAYKEKVFISEEILVKIVPYLKRIKEKTLEELRGLKKKIEEIELENPEVLNQTGGGSYNAPKNKSGEEK